MRNLLIILLLTQLTFSQSKPFTPEDKIYNSVEAFVANPNEKNLKILNQVEKNYHPKSKSELLALVILKCNKAYYQNQFGQTNNAIQSYETAWQLFEKNKLSNYDITENCLIKLGNLYIIIGDYDNAENIIKQYFYAANINKNQALKCTAINNLCIVYQNSGRINEAINLIEKTISSENLSNSQKGMLWNNLGNNYLASNKIDKAEKCYENSIKFLKDSNDSASLVNSYKNLALLNNDLDLFEKAKTLFFQNKKTSTRLVAKLYFEEATLYYQKNKFIEAQNLISKVFSIVIPNYSNKKNSLPSANSLYAETTLLDALDLQAALYLSQNQPKKALESYQLSFHIEDLFQSLLVYENSKIITQIRNRNRTEKCLATYYTLYQKEKKIAYLESAFALQEQTKSTVLKSAIDKNKTISREEKLILEQLQNWNTIIIKEQQRLDYADIAIINNAIKKQNELMLLLKSKESKTSKESKKKFNINELYAQLEKDKAIMVTYFYGTEKLYAFTLENHTIKIDVFEENNAEKSTVYDFLNYFKDADAITNNPNEYNNAANAVYTYLKIPKNKSNKNLIIIPDGILNFIPFEALITKKSTTTNFSKIHYLLKDFAVGYNNSATFYLNSIPFQHDKESILGVFPIFENSPLELTFSKKELENLKRNFSGTYLESNKATFKNFKINSANYSVLHLSTHASSGDIIEPASIKFYDQEILYSELYNLNIKPDLVVLSACETGLGKLYKAEGAMSIARGFQFAGAQNLLFSLWKVNDFTTSVLMEKFYKSIKSGKSYFDSNHQAKIDFLKDSTIPNAKKSPYYWSAFVYYGTLENKSSPINYALWLSILGSLIGLFLLYKFLKKWKISKKY
jgi:CHAT domain-containing protein/lipopolysaccharide biosynthesis regulator YciM